MILIQEILVSEALIEEEFKCNLKACKGACCWEGDYGAPLETEELHILEAQYEKIKPFLSPAGIKVLESEGLFAYYKDDKSYGTPLIDDRACAYLTLDESGIAKCGIEMAHQAGAVDFLKPISCHLYPVRVKENEKKGFIALNYDQWDICKAACSLGKKEKIPVFRFVKEALIRKFGNDFFEELEAAAEHLKKEKSDQPN